MRYFFFAWQDCLWSENSWKQQSCGTSFQKLFWPIARNNCSSDPEKLLKIQGWRPRICKIIAFTKTTYSWIRRVRTIFETEHISNLLLEVVYRSKTLEQISANQIKYLECRNVQEQVRKKVFFRKLRFKSKWLLTKGQ